MSLALCLVRSRPQPQQKWFGERRTATFPASTPRRLPAAAAGLWWGTTPLLDHGRWNAQHIYNLRVFPLVASIANSRTIPSFMLALFAISFFRWLFLHGGAPALRAPHQEVARVLVASSDNHTHGPCHCTAADCPFPGISLGDFNARSGCEPRTACGYS